METLSYHLYDDYESEDVELYAEQMIRERIARDEKRREQIEKGFGESRKDQETGRKQKTEVYKDKPYPREVQIPGIG